MIFRRRRTRIEIEHTTVRVQAVQLPSERTAHEAEGVPPMKTASRLERSAYSALDVPHGTPISQETRK